CDRCSAVDKQSHSNRRSMPAACRQTTEQRGLRSLVIKMKRLRIELGSECLDLLLIDSMRSAHKSLSHVKVLQVKAASSTRMSSKSHRTSVFWFSFKWKIGALPGSVATLEA